MKLPLSQAILLTVLYADVFDYPLREEELTLWCIGEESFTEKSFSQLLRKIPGKKITESNRYWVRAGRKRLVDIRQKREIWSWEKWQAARRVGNWLRFIPTVKLVGVTGGLSMNNADKGDDIDLFFIVSQRSLWITRLTVTVMVELFASRRHPGDQEIGNSICLNMFMAESALAVPLEERDLYSAHEVLQMQPLWDRGVYLAFLKANSWTKKYLGKAWKVKSSMSHVTCNMKQGQISQKAAEVLKILEKPAKLFQLWYMRKRRTTEVVTDTLVRFHPRDARVWVYDKLKKRCAYSGIPLDKAFWSR